MAKVYILLFFDRNCGYCRQFVNINEPTDAKQDWGKIVSICNDKYGTDVKCVTIDMTDESDPEVAVTHNPNNLPKLIESNDINGYPTVVILTDIEKNILDNRSPDSVMSKIDDTVKKSNSSSKQSQKPKKQQVMNGGASPTQDNKQNEISGTQFDGYIAKEHKDYGEIMDGGSDVYKRKYLKYKTKYLNEKKKHIGQ